MSPASASGWKDPALDMSQPVFLLLGVGGEQSEELQDEVLALLAVVALDIPNVAAIVTTSVKQERELWHLRADVYRLVAVHHNQAEAEARLNRLNRHFPTRAPRSALAPI